MDGMDFTATFAWRAPALRPEAARLASLLRRHAPLALPGIALTFGAAPASVPDAVEIGFAMGGAPARALLPRALRDSVLRALDAAAIQAGDAAANLLFCLALEPALAALDARFPALGVGFPAMDAAAVDALAIGIGCRLRDGTIHRARVELAPDVALALAEALRGLRAVHAGLPEVPVPLAIRLGAADLPLAELRAMRAGDVILPSAGLVDRAEAALVAGERLAWRATLAAGALTVRSRRRRAGEIGLEGWVMSEAQSEAADAPLDELPIRIVFEIGRVEMPLGEIESMLPGHVFPLGRDERQPVDIVANGRRIGQGEIVSIGGALGVRVLHLGHQV
jgi:type III secretion protein Q